MNSLHIFTVFRWTQRSCQRRSRWFSHVRSVCSLQQLGSPEGEIAFTLLRMTESSNHGLILTLSLFLLFITPFWRCIEFLFFKKPMDHHMCTDFFRVTLGVIFKWKSQTASSCVDYVAWLWLCTVLQAHVFVGVSCSWRKSVSFNDVVLSVLIVDWWILSVVTKLSASSLQTSKIKW